MTPKKTTPTILAILLASLLLPGCSQSEQEKNEYPSAQTLDETRDTLFYQRAVQSYLWALPALNMYAMKEASEAKFGKGYNVLPIWKERLNAKTLITTPNSDVIYAMGYLDLKADGPIVIEVPPGLQGILDDFYQRPIHSTGDINGKPWMGDVGLPGPDKGKGGKYLILPPDFTGDIPEGYFAYRSRTYGVFVFWRGFFQNPHDLLGPVRVMEQTRIYPLGKQADALPMKFPDASNVPVNMLYPTDASAFDMLKRFIDSEYVDPADFDMRGMLASIGIVKDQPFSPTPHQHDLLAKAAHDASEMGRCIAYEFLAEQPGGKWYSDRQYGNGFPPGLSPEFYSPADNPTYTNTFIRSGFFTLAYSASPAMAINMVGIGAKYLGASKDADGDFLRGEKSYHLHLPPKIPAKIFWSVTAYDEKTASGLDNGQPFPSINSMDLPPANADGSTDIYFGPTLPGGAKNWIATVPGKGFFILLRLYGPQQAFFEQTWKPDDIEEVK
jgi:hypothetical protein